MAKARKGEENAIAGWLEYGAALNEGAAKFTDENGVQNDRAFGEWISDNLSEMANEHEQVAAMWAAAYPDELAQLLVRLRQVWGMTWVFRKPALRLLG
ncbi:hypothetical protein [Ovoidimarina sediminis]|uniref:hypothetical protein n=1 Tax=Ovoidimarina sediminis TaxID=3079856 RepID=UPI00292F1DBA|nr:hypothetical protein [Rhodophyticola sp. MJ-SS7]